MNRRACRLLLALALPILIATACTASNRATPEPPVARSAPETASPPAPVTAPRTAPNPAFSATPDGGATATAMADARSETEEAAAVSTSLAATGAPVELGPWQSPDGRLAARVELWPCPPDKSLAATSVALAGSGQGLESLSYERLVIAGGANPETLVDSQLLNCGGLGAGGLDGRFWSPDSRVFYYTLAREGVPDGLDCGFQRWLRAWNAATGETSGPFTAAPDGSRVAHYAEDASGQPVVEESDSDLASPRRYLLPAGARPDELPHWSPDGAWLALLDLPAGCGHAPSAALALRLRDGHWLRQTPPAPDTAVIGLFWEANSTAIHLTTFGGDLRWDLASDSLTEAP